MRRTRLSAGRVILAVLAGAVTAPVCVLALMMATAMVGKEIGQGNGLLDAAGLFLMLAAVSILFGSPIALAGIVILFAPLWYIHRRLNGNAASFIALAALAGLALNLALWWIGGAGKPPEDMFLWIYPLAASLSGAAMWFVSNSGPREDIVELRGIPQANFTADEPST